MNQIPGLTSGWLVRVSAADGLGRRTERDCIVGEPEKLAAERIVRAGLGPGERARGIKPLFISELSGFGVAPGEMKFCRQGLPEAAAPAKGRQTRQRQRLLTKFGQDS